MPPTPARDNRPPIRPSRPWSPPTRTIPASPSSPGRRTAGPLPAGRHGRVDLRHLPPGDTTTLPTSTWLETFPFGDLNHPLERQAAPDFDWLQAPFAGGRYIGVYEGLAPAGLLSVRLAFVATLNAPAHPSEVYTEVVEP